MLETLKKHQILENTKSCEFTQQPLVYLGYVTSGGESKIDPAKMESITKWPIPTNVTEVRSFLWESHYLHKFGDLFLVVFAPLHAIKVCSKDF